MIMLLYFFEVLCLNNLICCIKGIFVVFLSAVSIYLLCVFEGIFLYLLAHLSDAFPLFNSFACFLMLKRYLILKACVIGTISFDKL